MRAMPPASESWKPAQPPRVEVPLSDVIPASQHQRMARDVDRAQLSGITVLCIDNDLTILDGMETLLAGWGCRRCRAAI